MCCAMEDIVEDPVFFRAAGVRDGGGACRLKFVSPRGVNGVFESLQSQMIRKMLMWEHGLWSIVYGQSAYGLPFQTLMP
ncbi:MAG: hypothetical protein MUO77_09405 [Anaerolineales bacterium]|nr:hypothetical protein [Anaerolineales bacterium]